MSYKKFGLIALIMSVIMVVSTLCLCGFKKGEPLTVNAPNEFIVYNHKISGTKVSETNNSENFEKLKNAFTNMTKLSIFKRLISGGNMNEQPSQDFYGDYSYFVNVWKQDNVCLEIKFETKQHQLVSINGNKKVLEFSSLMIVLKPETKITAIYINTHDGTPDYSNKHPLLVRADLTELYKICEKI